MQNFTRYAGVPKDSGGSYTPPETIPEEGLQLKRFLLKEKIADMMRYALPIIDTFPRRYRKMADTLRDSILELYRLATRVEKKYHKKTTLEELDIELATLKEFVIIASDKDFAGPKHAPPLTIKQREVWSCYTAEIGRMIGGYKKYVDSKAKQ